MKEEDLKVGMVVACYGPDYNVKILKIENGKIYYNFGPNDEIEEDTIEDFLETMMPTQDTDAIKAFGFKGGYRYIDLPK